MTYLQHRMRTLNSTQYCKQMIVRPSCIFRSQRCTWSSAPCCAKPPRLLRLLLRRGTTSWLSNWWWFPPISGRVFCSKLVLFVDIDDRGSNPSKRWYIHQYKWDNKPIRVVLIIVRWFLTKRLVSSTCFKLPASTLQWDLCICFCNLLSWSESALETTSSLHLNE